MLMRRCQDFGGGDFRNQYCVYCTDAAGKLKSREEVKAVMTRFMLKQGICKEESERRAEQMMREAPAWR